MVHYLDLGVVELLVNVVEAAVVAFLIDTVLKWMTRTELVDVKRAEAEVSDVVSKYFPISFIVNLCLIDQKINHRF